MLNFRSVIWFILLSSLLLHKGVADQPASAVYAAVLTVLQEGVTVQRAGTELPLPVRAGAVMPLGEGDQLQTGAGGRALVEFWPGAAMLLLPYSTYEQGTLLVHEAANGRQLAGRLTGSAVHRFSSAPTAYQLELTDGLITVPARQFATWSRADGPDAVTVSAGAVMLEAGENPVAVDEGYGWYAGQPPVTLAEPMNAAALIALYEGCAGEVRIDLRALNVREGPGRGYLAIGNFVDGDAVAVLGINQSSGWYRVRFNSHFGWVESLAVRARCDDLPRFADTTRETFVQAIGAGAEEREWLRPYFGQPAEDPWFYRP